MKPLPMNKCSGLMVVSEPDTDIHELGSPPESVENLTKVTVMFLGYFW